MKRILILAVAVAFVGVASTGCKKKEAKKAEPTTTEPKKEEPKKAEPKKEEPKKEEAKKEEASGGDVAKIGIKECDDYISKYMACVKSKMPEAARAQTVKAFNMTVDAWKKSAATANDAAKKAMGDACTKAMDAAKKAMAAYKCEW
jgi:hypothetical protein